MVPRVEEVMVGAVRKTEGKLRKALSSPPLLSGPYTSAVTCVLQSQSQSEMSQLDSQREVSAVDSEAQRSGREPGGPGVPDGHQGALGLGQPSLMGSVWAR